MGLTRYLGIPPPPPPSPPQKKKTKTKTKKASLDFEQYLEIRLSSKCQISVEY